MRAAPVMARAMCCEHEGIVVRAVACVVYHLSISTTWQVVQVVQTHAHTCWPETCFQPAAAGAGASRKVCVAHSSFLRLADHLDKGSVLALNKRFGDSLRW